MTENIQVPGTDLTIKSCRAAVRDSKPWKSRMAKDRLYIWLDRESVLDHLTSRWNKPVKEFRKALPTILEALGMDPTTKATWNQKGGCGCGCSPGFILDSHSGQYGYGRDIFVTLERKSSDT